MESNLFDLTSDVLALRRDIHEAAAGLEDPELSSQAVEALEALLSAEDGGLEALRAKADAYCWVIEELRAEAQARAEKAQKLQDLATAGEQRAKILQDRLIQCLQKVSPDETRWRLANHELASRRSSAVQVTCTAEELPEDLRRVKITTEPDKTAIKAAISAGRTVPGAEIVERRTWSIK